MLPTFLYLNGVMNMTRIFDASLADRGDVISLSTLLARSKAAAFVFAAPVVSAVSSLMPSRGDTAFAPSNWSRRVTRSLTLASSADAEPPKIPVTIKPAQISFFMVDTFDYDFAAMLWPNSVDVVGVVALLEPPEDPESLFLEPPPPPPIPLGTPGIAALAL